MNARTSIIAGLAMAARSSVLSVLLLHPASASEPAASAADGVPEVRICTQNLRRFGEPERSGVRRSNPARGRTRQLDALVDRFLAGRCDVVAVQEVYGRSEKEARQNLNRLAASLSERAGRRFRAEVGDARDPVIRNGLLFAEDIDPGARVRSHDGEQVPSLSRHRPSGYFIRAPLSIAFNVRKAGSGDREGGVRFFVLNVHAKSRRGGEKDPTGTQFEAVRLESAEAIRMIVERELAEHPSTVALIVGDRNSDELSASARVMLGERRLADFRTPDGDHGAVPVCRISKRLEPECQSPPRDPELVGLFELRRRISPKEHRGGSFRYRGAESLIDEIIVERSDLPLFRKASGSLAISFAGTLGEGSDHRLLVAEADF